MKEHPIIFTAESVRAIREGRLPKKIYPRIGEDYDSPTHLVRRLANGIKINEDSGCWEWQRATNGVGYGTLTLFGRRVYAHHLAYELAIGSRKNLQVLHDCDNPSCINPAHLHLGTRSDNMRECYQRGRSSIKPNPMPGESNGAARLSGVDVVQIREMLTQGKRQWEIAKQFGISQSQVSNINRGLRWKQSLVR